MLDNYNVETKLGEGASADVYLATNIQTNEKCALKILNLESKGDNIQKTIAQNEISVLRALDHQNIIKIQDADINV